MEVRLEDRHQHQDTPPFAPPRRRKGIAGEGGRASRDLSPWECPIRETLHELWESVPGAPARAGRSSGAVPLAARSATLLPPAHRRPVARWLLHRPPPLLRSLARAAMLLPAHRLVALLHTDSRTGEEEEGTREAGGWASHSGLDFAFRYRLICSCRTLSGAASPRGPSPRPSLRFSPAEQVASLRSSAGCPNQRSSAGSSLRRTPPTSVTARAAFSVSGVALLVESSLPAMTDLPAYPSVTLRQVAHADPAGLLPDPRRLLWVELCGLRPLLRGSAAGSIFRGSSLARPGACHRLSRTPPPRWFICIATCRFDSTPAPHPASRRRSWRGLRC